MPVVINNFEVVPQPQGSSQPPAPAPAPMPAQAAITIPDLQNLLRLERERAARLWAH